MPYKWIGKGNLKLGKGATKKFIATNHEIPTDLVTKEILERFGGQIIEFTEIREVKRGRKKEEDKV
jgi:hypothetical protein